jgi:hypothetical protein
LLSLFAFAAVAGTAGAGIIVELDGSARCDPETGDHVITWTFANSDISFDSALLGSSTVETTPPGVDTSTTDFVPDVVPDSGTATATTTLGGDFVGSVQITLDYMIDGETGTQQVGAGVELPDPCPQPVTTTTGATATTGAAPAAEGLARTPSFTG